MTQLLPQNTSQDVTQFDADNNQQPEKEELIVLGREQLSKSLARRN